MKLPKKHDNHPLFNCGKNDCPICAKALSQFRIKRQIVKEEFSTDAVAPFVGRYNYPNLNVGLLAPPEPEKDALLFDAPKYWADHNIRIPQIVDYRTSLINSRIKLNVKKRDSFLELNQEVSLASKPVLTDINVKKKPQFRVSYDNVMAPSGPLADLKKAKLSENPKIHTKVQKVFYDTDLKAASAVNYLYGQGFDENFLSRILSVGTLGIGKNRKLVPTRWSITATDDTIGKNLIKEVKDYTEMDFSFFFGNYLGNYYLIFCFPEVWSYELFELHVDNPQYMKSDVESFSGRKSYAENTAGGYYTVRLAILDFLKKKKRQGSFLALRFITGDYTLPLGVWVTREAARKAMKNRVSFESKDLMIKYATSLVEKKFGFSIDHILEKSVVLKNFSGQTKLKSFFQNL